MSVISHIPMEKSQFTSWILLRWQRAWRRRECVNGLFKKHSGTFTGIPYYRDIGTFKFLNAAGTTFHSEFYQLLTNIGWDMENCQTYPGIIILNTKYEILSSFICKSLKLHAMWIIGALPHTFELPFVETSVKSLCWRSTDNHDIRQYSLGSLICECF